MIETLGLLEILLIVRADMEDKEFRKQLKGLIEDAEKYNEVEKNVYELIMVSRLSDTRFGTN